MKHALPIVLVLLATAHLKAQNTLKPYAFGIQALSQTGPQVYVNARTASRTISFNQSYGFGTKGLLRLSSESQLTLEANWVDRIHFVHSGYDQYVLYGSATQEARSFNRFRQRTIELPLAYKRLVKRQGKWSLYQSARLVSAVNFNSYYHDEYLSRETTTRQLTQWSGWLQLSMPFERDLKRGIVMSIEPYVTLARVRQDDSVITLMDDNTLATFDEFGVRLNVTKWFKPSTK